ncbi:RNA-directed DNA polymerase [Citrobacter freundii]|uniref:RNA-directed DNA polymerase n=1 Tax=Citrobacter freundii TaxID=546 RepID=UPI001907632F|nr:RNA-directed DNA polymerase [Citrobacter freundii]MBJ8815885.1 RNA-directed DNA polymerase [Citrobacter freundii]
MELKGLLERGYFPKELPKPFTTEPFARLMDTLEHFDDSTKIPGVFGKPIVKDSRIPTAQEVFYSLARGGLQRRQLSICNPVLFYLLAKEIVSNWQEIKPFVSGSEFAATEPEFKTDGRAINGKHSQNSRVELARKNRIGAKYLLTTDISRFYHSIYTHSISWALHGKKFSKVNRRLDSLGNKLDYLVSQGQDGQTVGIPIGPDTSLVIAELLMHDVDKNLSKELPGVKGHRFIDDYELSFTSRDEAERAYHILNTNLSEFELALNTKKTQILPLPVRLEEHWVSELRRFQIRENEHSQSVDLEAYFSLSFELYNQYPNESVLQWAISCLRSVNVARNNWSLFQHLLMLCVAPEPACLPFVLEQILLRKRMLPDVLEGELTLLLNNLIVAHAELRHSSEVANALWGCLALRLKINVDAVNKISICRDSCIALLALDCEHQGLTEKALDKSIWEDYLNTDALYGDQWLLAYESNFKGWLKSRKDPMYVEKDPNFSFLKTNKVYFYRQRDSWDDDELPTTPSFMPYDG